MYVYYYVCIAILWVLTLIAGLSILGGLLFLKLGWFKFLYHDLLKWHRPSSTAKRWLVDGALHARCTYCRKEIVQDSQGNWKDWEREKIEEEKQYVAKYPFLMVRDINGVIDYDSKWPMICLEIPDGWLELFFQMCDDIKDLVSEDFYFIQVKEKYNELVCYTNNTTPEVEAVIQKYRYLSRYVCTICGDTACVETTGYLASLCDYCYKREFVAYPVARLNFQDTFEIVSFRLGKRVVETVSAKDAWDRYLKRLEE